MHVFFLCFLLHVQPTPFPLLLQLVTESNCPARSLPASTTKWLLHIAIGHPVSAPLPLTPE